MVLGSKPLLPPEKSAYDGWAAIEVQLKDAPSVRARLVYDPNFLLQDGVRANRSYMVLFCSTSSSPIEGIDAALYLEGAARVEKAASFTWNGAGAVIHIPSVSAVSGFFAERQWSDLQLIQFHASNIQPCGTDRARSMAAGRSFVEPDLAHGSRHRGRPGL